MSYVTSLSQGLPSSVSQTGLTSGTLYSGLQANSQSYLSRVPSLPENMYGTSHLYPPTAGSRQENTGYYPTASMNKLAESLKAPSSLGQHYYVDRMMNPHPYSNLYPFDMNAVRRKNATRETTGPLKAWLKQHRQNPYPTKGEKVMLAIGTRMTLTQVSTWFANARRRMKKDKFEDEEDDKEELSDDIAEKIRDRSGSLSSRASLTCSEADTSKDLSDLSDAEELNIKARPTKKCVQRLFSPDIRYDHVIDPSSSPESLPVRPPSVEQAFYEPVIPIVNHVAASDIPAPASTDMISQKPKIWSISEIIGSASQTVNQDISSYTAHTQSYPPYNDYYQSSLSLYGYAPENSSYTQQSAYAQQCFANSIDSYQKDSVQYL